MTCSTFSSALKRDAEQNTRDAERHEQDRNLDCWRIDGSCNIYHSGWLALIRVSSRRWVFGWGRVCGRRRVFGRARVCGWYISLRCLRGNLGRAERFRGDDLSVLGWLADGNGEGGGDGRRATGVADIHNFVEAWWRSSHGRLFAGLLAADLRDGVGLVFEASRTEGRVCCCVHGRLFGARQREGSGDWLLSAVVADRNGLGETRGADIAARSAGRAGPAGADLGEGVGGRTETLGTDRAESGVNSLVDGCYLMAAAVATVTSTVVIIMATIVAPTLVTVMVATVAAIMAIIVAAIMVTIVVSIMTTTVASTAGGPCLTTGSGDRIHPATRRPR